MSTSKLAEAARAVIDRWDSPAWKDAPHTGEYIHALRQALASYEAQAEAKPAEPFVTSADSLTTQLRGYAVAVQDEQPYWADKIKAACDALEAAPVAPAPDRTGMTYYKHNDCKAASADAADCICWTPAPAAPAPAKEFSDDELDALIPQWRHTTAAANEVCWQRRDVRQAMRAAIAASKGEKV